MRPERLLERAHSYVLAMRARAQRRKSSWNLLLAIFTFLGIAASWMVFAICVSFLYSAFHGPHSFGSTRTRMGGVFLYVPIFFPALSTGMLIGNALTWCVPQARNAISAEDATIGQTFGRAQQQLFIATAVLLALAAAFVIVGLIEPFRA